MKALDLQTFNIWESLGGALYADNPDDPRHPHNVGYEVKRKRLTDSELAAEYWAQVQDSQHAMTCEVGADHEGERESARHWGIQSTAKAATLFRFATLPHYDEQQGEATGTA